MLRLEGDGTYSTDVVGESHYQRGIERVVGGRTRKSAEHYCSAVLVIEDDNEYDGNAVRVDIDGVTVGYLPAEDAPDYRQWLRREHGRVRNATCPAVVVGGWDRGGGDRGHFGVKLDLPDFLRPLPQRRKRRVNTGGRRPAGQGGGSGWVVWLVVVAVVALLAVCGCISFIIALGAADR